MEPLRQGLNARRVGQAAKYSDIEPVECYISEAVHELESCTINDY